MSKPKPAASSASPASKSSTASSPKKAAPKKAAPRKRAAKKAAPTTESAPAPSHEMTDAERAYIVAAIARGEAQPADPSGDLPAGATHEIIETPAGEQVIRRRRFSAA